MQQKIHSQKTVFVVVFLVSVFLLVQSADAARVDELREKISSRSAEIAALEKEIAQYQTEIAKTGKEISSLASTIKTLDITQKKLETDIRVTEKKVDATTLTIESLEIDIENKTDNIDLHRAALQDSLRGLRKTDDYSPLEIAISENRFSEYWNRSVDATQFGDTVRRNLSGLKIERQGLQNKKEEETKQKKKLVELRVQLADQKQLAYEAQQQKKTLLSGTKNKESNYRKLLADRIARRDAFEKELLDFESQLRIEIDQSRLPTVGTGVLSYPLDSVFITQQFGNTDFSKTHAQVYNGNGHNGIDFRASPGTPIKSAQSGTVVGAGDTDTTCAGASYGKWVMVEHNNGLSTLYAHLSLIKVSEGQEVALGDVLGYSGNTGYSTGPHLHFTVFATQGVKIGTLKSKIAGCGTYRIPRASLNSYLNPLLYL